MADDKVNVNVNVIGASHIDGIIILIDRDLIDNIEDKKQFFEEIGRKLGEDLGDVVDE